MSRKTVLLSPHSQNSMSSNESRDSHTTPRKWIDSSRADSPAYATRSRKSITVSMRDLLKIDECQLTHQKKSESDTYSGLSSTDDVNPKMLRGEQKVLKTISEPDFSTESISETDISTESIQSQQESQLPVAKKEKVQRRTLRSRIIEGRVVTTDVPESIVKKMQTTHAIVLVKNCCEDSIEMMKNKVSSSKSKTPEENKSGVDHNDTENDSETDSENDSKTTSFSTAGKKVQTRKEDFEKQMDDLSLCYSSSADDSSDDMKTTSKEKKKQEKKTTSDKRNDAGENLSTMLNSLKDINDIIPDQLSSTQAICNVSSKSRINLDTEDVISSDSEMQTIAETNSNFDHKNIVEKSGTHKNEGVPSNTAPCIKKSAELDSQSPKAAKQQHDQEDFNEYKQSDKMAKFVEKSVLSVDKESDADDSDVTIEFLPPEKFDIVVSDVCNSLEKYEHFSSKHTKLPLTSPQKETAVDTASVPEFSQGTIKSKDQSQMCKSSPTKYHSQGTIKSKDQSQMSKSSPTKYHKTNDSTKSQISSPQKTPPLSPQKQFSLKSPRQLTFFKKTERSENDLFEGSSKEESLKLETSPSKAIIVTNDTVKSSQKKTSHQSPRKQFIMSSPRIGSSDEASLDIKKPVVHGMVQKSQLKFSSPNTIKNTEIMELESSDSEIDIDVPTKLPLDKSRSPISSKDLANVKVSVDRKSVKSKLLQKDDDTEEDEASDTESEECGRDSESLESDSTQATLDNEAKANNAELNKSYSNTANSSTNKYECADLKEEEEEVSSDSKDQEKGADKEKVKNINGIQVLESGKENGAIKPYNVAEKSNENLPNISSSKFKVSPEEKNKSRSIIPSFLAISQHSSSKSSSDEEEMSAYKKVKTVSNSPVICDIKKTNSVVPMKRKSQELFSPEFKKHKGWTWVNRTDDVDDEFWNNSKMNITKKIKSNQEDTKARFHRKLLLAKQLKALRNWIITNDDIAVENFLPRSSSPQMAENKECKSLKQKEQDERPKEEKEADKTYSRKEKKNKSVAKTLNQRTGAKESEVLLLNQDYDYSKKPSVDSTNPVIPDSSQESKIKKKKSKKRKNKDILLSNKHDSSSKKNDGAPLSTMQENDDSDDNAAAPEEQTFSAGRISAFAALRDAMNASLREQEILKKKRREKHERLKIEKKQKVKDHSRIEKVTKLKDVEEDEGPRKKKEKEYKQVPSKLPLSILQQLHDKKIPVVQPQQSDEAQRIGKKRRKKSKTKHSEIVEPTCTEKLFPERGMPMQISNVIGATRFLLADPNTAKSISSKSIKWQERAMKYKPRQSSNNLKTIQERLKYKSQGQNISKWESY